MGTVVPSWGQVGPSWVQVGRKLGQIGTKLGQVEPKLDQNGPTCEPKQKHPKNSILLRFFNVFWGSGGLELEPSFSCWDIFSPSWLSVGGLGSNLDPSWAFTAILAPSWGFLKPSWLRGGSKIAILKPKRGPSPLKDLQAEACRGSWSQVGRTLGPSWSQVGPKLE